MQEATCTFSADAESVRAARRFVSETAERWHLGDLAWPLVQIVSELASNAVIHAGTDFTVRLIHDGETTRIEVLDGSARRAQSRRYALDATTGRGLRLVENLSRAWGASGGPRGKTVWAVVDGGALLDVDSDAFAQAFLDADEDDDVAGQRVRKRTRRGRTSPPARLLAA